MSRVPDRPRILGVDDEPAIRQLFEMLLDAKGFSVTMVDSGEAFLRTFGADPPDAVLVDLNLPDIPGLELLKRASALVPGVPAVVVTGSNSVQDAVEAMRLGATDYVVKPPEPERLIVSVRNAVRLARQQGEIARLRAHVEESYAPEHLVGSSPCMEGLRALIRKVGAGGVAVLIQGETGTGKELVARAIHHSSPRRQGPFVDVNCAALTETLMESDIFGHEKGAFTGAHAVRTGLFEQADGGSIFLDEIGDMPLQLQPKILRVLQEGRFKRVGGERQIEVDVRVICATNQDLPDLVKKGRFRQDLLYRINAVTIQVPPLRERAQDVAELALHFLQRECRRQGRSAPRLSAEAMERLRSCAWPGNVRELEHAVERAVLLCEGHEIEPGHLPPLGGGPVAGEPGPSRTLTEAVELLETSMIRDALERSGGVKAQAARALGITERMISYKMQNLGIRPPGA